MRRNLKNAIGRCITNRLTGSTMGLSKLLQNFGSRSVAIAQDIRCASYRTNFGDQCIRKGRLSSWEAVPLPRHGRAGQLPMARGRIFSKRDFTGGSPSTFGQSQKIGRALTAGQFDRCAKAQPIQIGQMQRPISALISPPFSASLGNMQQRIGPRIGQVNIKKLICVGRATDTNRI